MNLAREARAFFAPLLLAAIAFAPGLALLAGVSTTAALVSSCAFGKVGQVEDMDPAGFARMKSQVSSYFRVGAWALVEEEVLEPEDVDKIATSLEGLASGTILPGAVSVFEKGLGDAGWTQPALLLLATELDAFLEARGFWEKIGPRTVELLEACAAAMREGAGYTQADVELAREVKAPR